MENPYRQRPDYQFWRRSFANKAPSEIDPVTRTRFAISKSDKVATAGSCFAQHVSNKLSELGFNYMIAEDRPASAYGVDENFGVFSARYGNIYTARQLKQLMQRAYGLFRPQDRAWRREDGRFVDPFRPYIQKDGFIDPQAVDIEREAHLAAVRNIFETCDVFIFTLGLTEAWAAKNDGAVFPICPGVVGSDAPAEDYEFQNHKVNEVEADLSWALQRLHNLNPACKVLLTVSPVALIATFEDKHVLSATTYSKSVLRVAAETMTRAYEFVDYFPSYEMITGPHGRGAFLEEDLREVRPEGVSYAMSKFAAHYIADVSISSPALEKQVSAAAVERQISSSKIISEVICDEENIDPNIL